MKKLFILCFIFFGCSYAPTYSLVRDSYNTNTYAPVYAPTTTETYAPTTYQNRPPGYTASSPARSQLYPTASPARSAATVPAYSQRTVNYLPVYPARFTNGYRPYFKNYRRPHHGMERRRMR